MSPDGQRLLDTAWASLAAGVAADAARRPALRHRRRGAGGRGGRRPVGRAGLLRPRHRPGHARAARRPELRQARPGSPPGPRRGAGRRADGDRRRARGRGARRRLERGERRRLAVGPRRAHHRHHRRRPRDPHRWPDRRDVPAGRPFSRRPRPRPCPTRRRTTAGWASTSSGESTGSPTAWAAAAEDEAGRRPGSRLPARRRRSAAAMPSTASAIRGTGDGPDHGATERPPSRAGSLAATTSSCGVPRCARALARADRGQGPGRAGRAARHRGSAEIPVMARSPPPAGYASATGREPGPSAPLRPACRSPRRPHRR